MFFQGIVAFCLALSGARLVTAAPHLNARQEYTFASIPPSTNLTWYPCFTSVNTGFTCALLDVPLDYANPTGKRAHVPFIRYAATSTPYSGMIITNPGGPGESGVNTFLGEGPEFPEFIGSNYDFVSFDPRGYSIPLANCSASVASSTAPLTRRFVDQLHGPRFDAQFFSKSYQSAQTLGQQCQATIGSPEAAGPYMNSAVVARDLVSFLDAYASSTYSQGVASPNILNYWGFSYGSYLGQVFANLFPDRVGRVVLDAVVDAAANLAGRELQPVYGDEAFSTFFVYCNLAGASLCPYYKGSTANDILARFEATVTKLDPTLAKLKGWANATVIELTLEAVKLFSYQAAYYPIPLPGTPASYPSFPALASFLIDAEAAVEDLTMAAYQQLETKYALNIPGDLPEWPAGIQCTDNGNILNGRPFLTLLPEIAIYETQSYILGEYQATLQIRCSGWPIVGKGRYPGNEGPFGGATKNPILFVSNTRDPVLPVQNGQKGASIYEAAQLLTVDGTGHTSAALFNFCAFGKIATFFQTGALPGSDNFCLLEAGPWGVLATDAELKKRGLAEIQSSLKAMIRAK